MEICQSLHENNFEQWHKCCERLTVKINDNNNGLLTFKLEKFHKSLTIITGLGLLITHISEIAVNIFFYSYLRIERRLLPK